MSRAAPKARTDETEDGLDLSKARVIGRGIHAKRGLHMPLRSLRAAVNKTQTEVSDRSGIAQGDVSRIETRDSLDDCLVSTLRRYLEALGARLELVAVFPKGHRIAIAPADKER
jgi:hypothetical protein